MNPSRLATIVLSVALMPALPCVAQQAGAPMPGATHDGQLGPGFPQIPMTPSTISPGRQKNTRGDSGNHAWSAICRSIYAARSRAGQQSDFRLVSIRFSFHHERRDRINWTGDWEPNRR